MLLVEWSILEVAYDRGQGQRFQNEKGQVHFERERLEITDWIVDG